MSFQVVVAADPGPSIRIVPGHKPPLPTQVLDHLTHIAYGRTESYAEVAAGAGNPRAVRAVGTACATNPLVVVVPCHRVVRSDGSAGGYAGGVEAKATLLALEAA